MSYDFGSVYSPETVQTIIGDGSTPVFTGSVTYGDNVIPFPTPQITGVNITQGVNTAAQAASAFAKASAGQASPYVQQPYAPPSQVSPYPVQPAAKPFGGISPTIMVVLIAVGLFMATEK